eukprot:gnl/TRDRNA2_/TRDRNA2_182061_c0_seq1.p1 gnl/TRDRNA2_/TRDRNA2_182061_c0~~gnl/TRDRNA2_/TRDRNA2_182061_c0_seq1.p1  ORF type:complete len:484 (+),score=103.50 gnl/TRDRNA2_/TRDRNA2_182061_c0_seq1:162-1613(+)
MSMFAPGDQPAEAAAPAPTPSPAELRRMRGAFRDAKDQWKIDGQTLKGFYLHSESGYLYIWNQPTGILYEYDQGAGQCQAVWTAACPQLNAEIWTVLPLPPTDPASLQAATSMSGQLPNPDVFLVLSVNHEDGKQLPADAVEETVMAFCEHHGVNQQARQRLREMPAVGQGYICQNFREKHHKGTDKSKALMHYIHKHLRRNPPRWGTAACTLRVEATGAILGTSNPDLAAICRDDPPERLSAAHCKIMSEQDRFFVCDLNTTVEGTSLDGFQVGEDWVGPLKTGSVLSLGPLQITISLSDMAQDKMPEGAVLNGRKRAAEDGSDSDTNCGLEGSGEARVGWKAKVFKKTAKTAKEEEAERLKRQASYKDRAEERRQRSGGNKGAALDTLVQKFEHIKEAERIAEEEEENRVEEPTLAGQREANMSRDGSFAGWGGGERAGIGFAAEHGDVLIPNVLDPKGLSEAQEAKLKTKMRYEQLFGKS